MRIIANKSAAVDLSGLEIVTNPERLQALKPEWDALWLRCGTGGVFQSFDCCLNAWQSIAQPERRRLFCLIGWERGEMVAAWPLTRYRKFAWKFVRPLDASGAESADILIDRTVDQAAWMEAAWQVLSEQSKSDLVVLPYLRKGTAINDVLSRCAQKSSLDHDVTVFVPLKDEENWRSYYDSLSQGHERSRAQKRRKLAGLGKVEFEVIDAGDRRCPDLVAWILSQKQVWAEKTNKQGHWLYSDRYRDFLTRLVADPAATPKSLIMALTLDGTPIAATVFTVGLNILEGIISGFDARYEKCSPGIQLSEHCVKWALESKLDLDYGSGGERYKRFWSRNQVIQTATYHVANSLWGLVAIRCLEYRKTKHTVQQVNSDVSVEQLSHSE